MSVLRPNDLLPISPDQLFAQARVEVVTARDGQSVQITGITLDSSAVSAGDLFAALPGSRQHGAHYALAAVRAGAVAVLTDEEGAQLLDGGQTPLPDEVPVFVVDRPRPAVGRLAAVIFGRPSETLDVIGITGTNGKTTTSYLVDAALKAAGRRTALLGTVETRILDQHLPQDRTTPEAPDLQAILAVARERGADAAVMEVSSHALSLGRVAGTKFRAAVFTNLSQDHLDFHESMDDYFAAKLSMFRAEMADTAVVCVDDEWGERVMERTRLPHVTYSVTGVPWADWQAQQIVHDVSGSRFQAIGPAGEVVDVSVQLPGSFNVANALGALAAAVAIGVDPAIASVGIGSLVGVPGRLERVNAGSDFAAFVDFAHTPDAVRHLLAELRELTPGRLVVVLGCGGDRDRTKRPAMARAAAEGADLAIFTSDNPRSEDPAAILTEMTDGLNLPYRVEPDRRAAIALALQGISAGDTVVLAGKGHETGQESAGVVTPFDDRVVLRELIVLRERSAAGPGTGRSS